MKLRVALRRTGRALLFIVALLTLLALALTIAGWRAFGHRAEGRRRARMEASPEWSAAEGSFVDPQPIVNDNGRILRDLFKADPNASPNAPLPPTTATPIDPRVFAEPPPSGLRVTWLGHSSTLIEIDGARVLSDPMWSERVSPFTSVGPKRWYPPLIAIADLPAIDAVVISHDHYDHLDERTVEALAAQTKAIFYVPLGICAHLAYWGVPEERIVELDWWGEAKVPRTNLTVTLTPSRHASGRFLLDRDTTLWGGYAITGPGHRAYLSGDSGFFPALKEIGDRLGPFDVSLIEIGQYDQSWPDWHMGPERAVEASTLVRARVLLPYHWGLFALAKHGWTEPIERTLAAAKGQGVTVATPHPGELVEPTLPLVTKRWWPDLPWRTAEQDPLVTHL
jgi:L-ascorbate metabolism protein UlaG (beta-lactamase superfamily)